MLCSRLLWLFLLFLLTLIKAGDAIACQQINGTFGLPLLIIGLQRLWLLPSLTCKLYPTLG